MPRTSPGWTPATKSRCGRRERPGPSRRPSRRRPGAPADAQGGARSVPTGARRSTRDNPHGLTAREQDVLDQVVAGLANPEIARALFITPKTVEHHISHVLAKLGVPDRRAAAALVRGGRD